MARITRSTRKGKKWKVTKGGRTIHAGAKGYSIAPGTAKGDRYCTRSSGIPGATGTFTPNGLARAMWGCVGKKSIKARATRIGDDY